MKYILKIAICFAVLVYAGVFLCNSFLGEKITEEKTKESSESFISEQESSFAEASEPMISALSASEESSETAAPIIDEPILTPTFTLSTDKIKQGDLLVLKGENVKTLPIIQSKLMDDIKAYKDDSGNMTALIPIKYTNQPSEYYVTVTSLGIAQDLPVEVLKTDFPTVNIEVEEETKQETISNKAANDEYFEKVQPFKTVDSEEALWSGKFMPPVKEYRITGDFGEIRSINGVPSDDRHGGLDMAAPTGTPVYATNDGEILFAEKIALTGNTIMIEHGFGLKSHYYHMDSLHVNSGDLVKKGDLIGTVGTTGFSTGPHLHFAVSIERTYFNPKFLFEEEIKA